MNHDDQRREILVAAIARLAGAVLIVFAFTGCKTTPKSGRIVQTNYDPPACDAALAQAEAITGRRYAGQGIRVTATKGTKQVAGGQWVKVQTVNGKSVNVGGKVTGGKDRQYISIYTDPQGRERPNELLHEMGHAVLWSHGVYGHPAAYRGRFERWQD